MSTRDDPMEGLPPELLAARRRAVLDVLGHGVMVLPAAPILQRSRDTEHPYRPDSELFYLTGATEPGTVAVLAGGAEPRFVLFARERDPDAELWTGERLGPEAAAERFGADEAFPLGDLEARLTALLRESDRVYYRPRRAGGVEGMVMEALAYARGKGQRKGTGPRALVDPGEILDDMRLLKDEVELRRLRRAAEVTLTGHRAALDAMRPGVGEWAVQAAVEASFLRGGATAPGFGTIVGSGANGCFLHYVDNRKVVAEGDLVLVDAGAEVALYNGDVTRTAPASGRFSDLQRAVYEVVERARAAAAAAACPGGTIGGVHDAAVAVLAEGLVSLGVLTGSVEDVVAQGAYKPFYPHQTSHWIGLDVHDCGDYAREGASRTLEPGMVFTVEPGLYFRPGGDGPGARFEGIGVRIEDDVVVTETGCENLTAALPTAPEEIEALVAGGAGGSGGRG
jgi:Xaa-Pro aminopeptidase